MRAAQEMLQPLQEACRARERAEEEGRERRFRARTARLPERREKLEGRIAKKHAQMAAAWREAVQRERAERAKGKAELPPPDTKELFRRRARAQGS